MYQTAAEIENLEVEINSVTYGDAMCEVDFWTKGFTGGIMLPWYKFHIQIIINKQRGGYFHNNMKVKDLIKLNVPMRIKKYQTGTLSKLLSDQGYEVILDTIS